MADKQKFVDFVRKYSAWKLQEKGTQKVTKDELKSLREAFRANESDSSRPARGNARLTEAVKNFRAYKLKKTGSDRITETEYAKLREAVAKETTQSGSFSKLVENYKLFKATRVGKDARVSYKEMKALKEAFDKSGGRLREADQGFDPTGGLGGDPNAGFGAQPGAQPPIGAPGAPVDPAIVSQIQDVKNSVDALATAAGIQTSDMNGDPNAAIPAVDGLAQPGAAPAAPAAQPMLESLTKEYRAWKEKKTGDSSVSQAEMKHLAEAVQNQGAQSLLEHTVNDYRAWKQKKTGSSEITSNELKKLAEASGINEKAQKLLESLTKDFRSYKYKKTGSGEITKSEISKLTEAAIEQTRTDETKPKSRIDAIRERIEKRQAQMSQLNENAAQDLGRKTLSKLGGPQQRADFLPNKSHGTAAKPDTAASDELVKVPGASSLASGHSGGKGTAPGKTWPTKEAKNNSSGPLQGKGATQGGAKGESKIYESVTSVTDEYIDRELNTPKLDFNRLKEALTTGLLG
jgi:hypothetical protein